MYHIHPLKLLLIDFPDFKQFRSNKSNKTVTATAWRYSVMSSNAARILIAYVEVLHIVFSGLQANSQRVLEFDISTGLAARSD